MPENSPQQFTSPPDEFRLFLELQHKEVDLRSEEQKTRKNNDNNSFEYAKLNLDATKADKKEEREFHDRQVTKRYFFTGFIFLIFTSLMAYGMFLGKETMVYEIIKILGSIGIGGIGGYSLKAIKDNS